VSLALPPMGLLFSGARGGWKKNGSGNKKKNLTREKKPRRRGPFLVLMLSWGGVKPVSGENLLWGVLGLKPHHLG